MRSCSFLGSGKSVGGSPSAFWEDSTRQSQAVFTLFVGMTRCEAIWLAQDALLTRLVNSCTMVGRTLPVIVPFLFIPGRRKGSCGPLLQLPGKTDRGNLRWWMLPLLGLTRCELVWLAQNAFLTSHCIGDLFRTVVPSYLFVEWRLTPHHTASGKSLGKAKSMCTYIYIYIYIHI